MSINREDLAKAEVLVDLGRSAEAEGLLRTLLAGDPEHPDVLHLLTRCLLDSDRDAEALTAARLAVAVEPNSEYGYRLLAIASSEAGTRSEAESAAREAVRLAPGSWHTHYTLASVLEDTPAGRHEALTCALHAVELAPHESMTHNLAGVCLSRLGREDEAVLAYSEAIRLNPNDAMALNNLAARQLQKGRLSQASATLRSGLSAEPHRESLRRNYDIILLQLVQRLYVALYVVFLLQIHLAHDHDAFLIRVAVGLALVIVCAAGAVRVTRQLPRGTHLWARGLLHRVDLARRLMVIRFLLVLVVDLAIALAPAAAAVTIGTVGFVLFLGLLVTALVVHPRSGAGDASSYLRS